MKKSKAGILTLYYDSYNYGGILQAFALPYYINNNLNLDAEQICFDYRNKQPKSDINKKRIKNVRNYFSIGFSHGIHTILIKILNRLISFKVGQCVSEGIDERKGEFNLFSRAIPHSNKIYYDDTIDEAMNYYDIFVCGGDQIWNDWGSVHSEKASEVFTLSFVDNLHKKISYAPSIPSSKLEKSYLDRISYGISNLDYISVREKSSVSLVESLSGKKVCSVLDPVLLLKKDDWERVMTPPNQSDYLFCYLLGEDIKQRKLITKYAKKRNLKLVTLPYLNGSFRFCDWRFGDIRNLSVGPKEFIGLIAGADCVITDSFHAMVFSTIFHKDFFVLERDTVVGGEKMNKRMIDFCDEIGLTSRLIKPKNLIIQDGIQPIDYLKVDQLLAEKRKKSIEFLKDALNN